MYKYGFVVPRLAVECHLLLGLVEERKITVHRVEVTSIYAVLEFIL